MPAKLSVSALVILFPAVTCLRAAPASSQLPEGPGKATVQRVCSGCHAPEIVVGRRDTKAGWEQIVSNMVDKGANGTDDEFNQIIDYLALHFPKQTDPPAEDPHR